MSKKLWQMLLTISLSQTACFVQNPKDSIYNGKVCEKVCTLQEEASVLSQGKLEAPL